MGGNTLLSPAQRVGVTKGAILKHAEPKEALGITGTLHDMAKNVGDTVKYRRWLPYGGSTTNANTINRWSVTVAAHQLQEGQNPEADGLESQDITVTMRDYGAIYYYTNYVEDLYEDDVPRAQKMILGQRMGLVREMIRYGTLQGCTNKFYASGSTRATVAGKITLNALRVISKSLKGNHGEFITEVLKPGAAYGTVGVEQSFLVFVHTDAENDIRNLPGFKETIIYASGKPIHKCEIGAVDNYRFIMSPELNPIINSGAAVGSTGLYSTGGTNIDVYPFIIVAADAWGDVALKGSRSFDYSHLPPGQKDKSDVLGKRGYVGASFYSAMFIQNDGWMAVLEAGITSLSA
jgi:N4-gp56 family major capsid protein